jgi:hypothetical protein
MKFHGPWLKAAGRPTMTYETDEPVLLEELLSVLEKLFGSGFSSHGEGLVCLLEDDGPRALKKKTPVFPGSTLVFLGTVESG